ncbi:MAG: YciC family protein [Gammaproteobacteria bacterium]|nr:YciC family protein [Gammaproteobacteria bacterium]
MFALADQPQSIGKNLDNGIKLYIAGLAKVLPLTFIAASLGVVPDLLNVTRPSIDNPAVGAGMLGFLLVYVVVMIVVSFAIYGAVIYQYGAIATGHSVSMMDSVKRGFRCIPRLLGGGILYVLAIMIGMVLLVIPGIILMVSLALFSTAIMLDDEKAVDSLKLSHSLVWGNWWRTVILFTVPMFIIMALYFLLGAIFGVSMMAGGAANLNQESIAQTALMVSIAGAAINAVVTPLFYGITIVVYNDLKLRRSGSDLQAKLAAAT